MVAGPALKKLCSRPAVLAPAALATALVATAAVGVIAGRPVAARPAASQAAIDARAVVAGKAQAPARRRRGLPGWRVVAAIGPYNEAVTGTVSAGSATDAWSVWTGTAFTAVERLDRNPLVAGAAPGRADRLRAVGGRLRRRLGHRLLAVQLAEPDPRAALRRRQVDAPADPWLGAAAAVRRGRAERQRRGVRPGRRLGSSASTPTPTPPITTAAGGRRCDCPPPRMR